MVLRFFRRGDGELLDRVEAKIQAMLRHDRYEFDLAMGALLGETVAAEVNDELRSTDRKVNQLEREIRRELLIHSSVIGGIDTPAILVYMSIVKDIERIGDYAKNLLDLARDGVDFRSAPDVAMWRELRIDVGQRIAETAAAFEKRNAARSRELLPDCDRLLKKFDAEVSRLVRETGTSELAVPRALAHRYLKRVVAHLMNILSSIVMPLDKLDYFDEDPEDRAL